MTTGPSRWPAPPTHAGVVRVVPLTSDLLAVDTEAYLASPRAIAAHSAGRWPTSGFDVEANRGLVAGHEAEHAAGAAFAYAILDAHVDRGLGCAYLRPLEPFLAHTGTSLSRVPADAAILSFWAIDDVAARPPGVVLLGELLAWTTAWGAAPVVVRLLPEEAESLAAAQDLGLREVSARGQELDYRWFAGRPGG